MLQNRRPTGQPASHYSAVQADLEAATRLTLTLNPDMPTPDLLLSLKPILSALILPPVPFVLLMLVAVRVALAAHRKTAAGLALLAAAGWWLSTCVGTAVWLQQVWVTPPAALPPAALEALRQPARRARAAIVVLGGGMELEAPEYGQPTLSRQAAMRLRYGVWLARHTGVALAVSGGVGWAQRGRVTEAEVAARIAREEWQQPVRWQENRSRDTRENARWTVDLLRQDGVHEIVLVTHAYHMPRAVRAFEQAAGGTLTITPAPMDFVSPADRPVMNWLPTTKGSTAVYDLAHEWVGWWMGA